MQIFDTQERKEQFVAWIEQEIRDAESERTEQKETWKKWRRQREARPERKKKDYPWPGASNLCVPVANIVATTMYGHLKKTFGVKDPFFTATALNKKSETDAEDVTVLTRYINMLASSPFEIDLRRKNRDILYEAGSMGTCFAKVVWSTVPWTFKQVGPDGVPTTVVGFMHDGVDVIPVPIDDLIHRQAIQDVQRAVWVAHQYLVTDIELTDAMALGELEDLEKVLQYEVQVSEEWRADVEDRMGVTELPDKVKKLHEVYWREDIDGDGFSEECIATVHLPTRTVIESKYNEIGMRPFVPVNYMHRPFFIHGMGTGWLSEHGQDEIDTIHNQRIDAMHIAILPMFSSKKGSGIKPNERLFPGKIFQLSSAGDIAPLMHGGVNPISERAEGMGREYVQKATGMSDAMMGFADQTIRTRDTAMAQNTRIQQGTQMTSSIIEAAEDSYARIAALVLFNLVAKKDTVIAKEREIGRLTDEEVTALERALTIELKDIPTKVRFEVRTTDVEQTIQQKQQNLLFQVQLQNQFYDRTLPLMMQMVNPQMPEPIKMYATKIFTASMRTLERILKFYDESDVKQYVPEYQQLEMLNDLKQTMLEMQYGMQAQQLEAMLGRQMGGGIGRAAALPAGSGVGAAGAAWGAESEEVPGPSSEGAEPQFGMAGGGSPGAGQNAPGPGGNPGEPG